MSVSNMASDITRWIGGVFVPMFLPPVTPAGLAWFLHILLLSGTAVGLYFAQPHLGLTAQIGHGPSAFRPFWLPALFLLCYALVWSAVWLWRLLAPNQPVSCFPDIDAAWADIRESLEKAGVGLGDTPMYLVLGEWPCGYEPIFRGLPGGLAVCGGTSPGAPLQAFANRDGIYIAVPGACLLGFRGQLAEFAGSDPAASADAMFRSVGIGQSIGIGQSVGIGRSMAASVGGSQGAGGPLQEIQKIIKAARDQNRPLTDDEKRRVRDLSSGGGGGDGAVPLARAKSGGGGGLSVLQNPQMANELAARLAHVCGLLAATRWPLCPINGAIVAVPIAATATDEGAQQWGLVAREDLLIADYALKLRFPVYFLLGGAEDLPGGRSFFTKFAAEKSGQRLGKGFPLNPDITPDGRIAAVESVAKWVFGGLLSYWTLRFMRADSTDDTRTNSQLVRFLSDLDRRSTPLARLVSRAIATEFERPPLFAGIYLAVVLPDSPNEAKFAKEFFAKVDQTQGYVQWTEAALADDASYRNTARLGTLAAGALMLGVILLASYVAYTKLGK